MRCHHHFATAAVAIVAGFICSNSAQANVRVGGTVSVVRDVSGSLSGDSWQKKNEGDDVEEKEFIRTESGSTTGILFIDDTGIRVGPAATMRIVRAVFNSRVSYRALEVSFGAGAARWNSGNSTSDAYKVETPTAIITVEGTTFDLVVESQRTTVVLRRGRIKVCLIEAPRRCKTLSRPDDIIVATRDDLRGPARAVGLEPSEFANQCLNADMTPCIITTSLAPTKSGAAKPRSTYSTTGVAPTRSDAPRPRSYSQDTRPTHPSGELAGSAINPTPERKCYQYRGRVVCGNYRPMPGPAGTSAGYYRPRGPSGPAGTSAGYYRPRGPYVPAGTLPAGSRPRATYVPAGTLPTGSVTTRTRAR
jgi:FecR protein